MRDKEVSKLAKSIRTYAFGYWYAVLVVGLFGIFMMVYEELNIYINIIFIIIISLIFLLSIIKKNEGEDLIAEGLAKINIRLTKLRSPK